MKIVDTFGSYTRSTLESVGLFFQLVSVTFSRIPTLLLNPHILFFQMRVIGVESLGLVIFTALFVGAETVVQAQYQLTGLAPISLLGFAVSKGIITELAPIITAFVVSSRISTSIAAEIANMKSSDQIDALETLSLDLYRYIIVPKVSATTLMLPILVIVATFFAFIASIVVVYFTIDMPMSTYTEGLQHLFSMRDVYLTLGKTTVFGAVIGFSGVYFGLTSQGGAMGIGNATTKAVMLSAILILVVDFITALLFL